MKKDRLDNVRAEKVMVPHWVRGEESLEMISPVTRSLTMLGLGNSVGTPEGGITAEVVVVRNFDELEALGEKVRDGSLSGLWCFASSALRWGRHPGPFHHTC
jgi:hypothetical protein